MGVRKRVVSKRVALADVPGPQKPERGYKKRNDGTENRKEGTKKRNGGTKNRNEGTFPKTALLQNRPVVSSQFFEWEVCPISLLIFSASPMASFDTLHRP